MTRSHFVQTLIKYSKLYCKYTKLAGFRYFVESKTTWFDRTLWFLMYAVTVPAMVYMVYNSYLEFMENPLFTSVETEYFPTHELNFPGIAICSVNRISRQSATKLANEISAANITDLSLDEILGAIFQLGDLYDSEFMMQNTYQIDQLLTIFYNGSYSITELMKRVSPITRTTNITLTQFLFRYNSPPQTFQLTPQCSSMLSKCRFHDEERNCSELFAFRKTQDGFCCTFNYATKGDDTHFTSRENGTDHRLEPMKVENLTESGGLSVLLESSLDDYFYPIFPSAEWKINLMIFRGQVTIFNPHDYPDMTSGGVIDFLVSPRKHRSVELEAIVFYSIRNIIPYPLEKRDCVFQDEMTSFHMFYTYSDCIVDCKIEDIWNICRCVPFFLPNRTKWFSVIPHENLYNIEDVKDILSCGKCYPECNAVNYNAKISIADLESNQHVAELLDNVDIKNQSVLTIYFRKYGTIRLRQDVIYRWYELMGDASGICGIFVGFSLIAIVEFAYFVGLFMLELLKGPSSSDGDGKRAESKQPPIQTIYWVFFIGIF
ncbi:Sodium channel protein Nach [Apis cerana cerana]|uniref:Sodium channel protein Nach n=1 Tax=Apis cerana cerana TaxID=94128 RepID=A0A2A3EN15_APICC|nr:Sodium channel protein Nach [Apis cerana cerana]